MKKSMQNTLAVGIILTIASTTLPLNMDGTGANVLGTDLVLPEAVENPLLLDKFAPQKANDVVPFEKLYDFSKTEKKAVKIVSEERVKILRDKTKSVEQKIKIPEKKTLEIKERKISWERMEKELEKILEDQENVEINDLTEIIKEHSDDDAQILAGVMDVRVKIALMNYDADRLNLDIDNSEIDASAKELFEEIDAIEELSVDQSLDFQDKLADLRDELKEKREEFGRMKRELKGVSNYDKVRAEKYLEKKDLKLTIERIYADLELYDDERGRLLADYLDVLEVIDVDKVGDLPLGLKSLYFKTIAEAVSPDRAEDLIAAWREAIAAFEAGERNLSDYESAIEEILKGESEVEFSDIPYNSDEWYRDFVFKGRGKFWNGYGGARSGEFGPNDSVTFAEILKMAMESAGIEVDEAAEEGAWYEAYVAKARSNDYEFVERVRDWDAPAKRIDVAVIIAEVYGLEEVDYRNVYPDVFASNKDAEYLQAVYDAGFMTGKGDGRFDGNAKINRAEAAKVIIEALDYEDLFT